MVRAKSTPHELLGLALRGRLLLALAESLPLRAALLPRVGLGLLLGHPRRVEAALLQVGVLRVGEGLLQGADAHVRLVLVLHVRNLRDVVLVEDVRGAAQVLSDVGVIGALLYWSTHALTFIILLFCSELFIELKTTHSMPMTYLSSLSCCS